MPFGSVFALSYKAGTDALRKQFSRGQGPGKERTRIDYSFYSPVKGKNDKTKYPLMVIIPGQGENKNPGDELQMNDFCTWSADEYQKRFEGTHGAFIMIARAREENLLSWNQPVLTVPLDDAIEDFANKHQNVDKSRIYIYGWSYGGMAALRAVIERPDMFAGVIAACPTILLSEEHAEKLKNTAVWMVASKSDTIAPYSAITYPTWERIKQYHIRKDNIRFTTYEDAPNTDNILNHNGWREMIHDFDKNIDGYSGRKTVDGNGNEVSLKGGMLNWMSKQILYTAKCTHECHIKSVYIERFWKIRVHFWVMFDSQKYRFCACGERHW